MRKEVLLDNYVGMIDEKYTFAGVLVRFYDEIFARCAANTRYAYNSAYNMHILPMLKDRVMETLTLEDCEAVIEAISQKKDYELATLERYRYLIRAVVKHAVQKGICEDVLFGSVFSLNENDNENEKKLVRLKKSLSVEEELLLYEQIMKDPTQDGGRMGLALMFSLGMRNNEACAMKFSSIREMQHNKGKFCAWVLESTEGRTNNSKAGGKTINAPRKIPVPTALLELLQRRKRHIQSLIDNGDVVLEQGMTVDGLPITCKRDYQTNYTSEELTAIGRQVLREIRVNEDQLAYIDKDLQDEKLRMEMDVSEKDPTAYLLRRNFATHLYILHLTEPEIQYIMGHNMEDIYANRHDYSSEEQLTLIATKMDKRPLFNDKLSDRQPEVLSQQNESVASCDVSSFTLRTDDLKGGGFWSRYAHWSHLILSRFRFLPTVKN